MENNWSIIYLYTHFILSLNGIGLKTTSKIMTKITEKIARVVAATTKTQHHASQLIQIPKLRTIFFKI